MFPCDYFLERISTDEVLQLRKIAKISEFVPTQLKITNKGKRKLQMKTPVYYLHTRTRMFQRNSVFRMLTSETHIRSRLSQKILSKKDWKRKHPNSIVNIKESIRRARSMNRAKRLLEKLASFRKRLNKTKRLNTIGQETVNSSNNREAALILLKGRCKLVDKNANKRPKVVKVETVISSKANNNRIEAVDNNFRISDWGSKNIRVTKEKTAKSTLTSIEEVSLKSSHNKGRKSCDQSEGILPGQIFNKKEKERTKHVKDIDTTSCPGEVLLNDSLKKKGKRKLSIIDTVESIVESNKKKIDVLDESRRMLSEKKKRKSNQIRKYISDSFDLKTDDTSKGRMQLRLENVKKKTTTVDDIDTIFGMLD